MIFKGMAAAVLGIENRFLLCADDGDGGGGAGDGGDKGGGDGDKPAAGLEAGLLANAGKDGDKGGNGKDKDQGPTKTVEFKGAKIEVPEAFIDKDTGDINVGAAVKAAGDLRISNQKLGEDLKTLQESKGVEAAPKEAADYLTDDMVKDDKIILPEGNQRLNDIPLDDPGLTGFMKIAQEHKLSPKQFSGVLNDVMKMADGMMPEPFNEEAEKDKLGKDGGKLITGMRTRLDALLKEGTLSDAEYGWAMQFGAYAVGVSALNKIFVASGAQPVIPTGGGSGVGGELPSVAEWYKAIKDPREDPEGYAVWQKQGEELFGTGTELGGTARAGMGLPASHGASAASLKALADERAAKGKGS